MFLHAAEGRLDELRLVAHDADAVARRQRTLNVRQPFLDVVDHFDRVRTRLLADLKKDRRVAVDVGECRHVGDTVVDAGDVGDLHRVTVDLTQHETAKFLR